MFKKLLALASLMTCALITHGANALEPAVAFVGGNIMYNWQASGLLASGFPEGIPLFLEQGFTVTDAPGICRETQQAQTAVNGLLPYTNIIAFHVMVGADDVMGTDDANPPAFVFNQWQTCYTNLVNSILAANRKVVLGTIPFTIFNDPKPYNDFIFTLAAQKGIQVIDYYTLLRHANDNFEGTQYWIPESATVSVPSVTSKGYALMTGLAQTVLDQVINGVTLKSGYLGVDTVNQIGDPPFVPASGISTIYPNSKMHFQAWGTYSDNTNGLIQNGNINGVFGKWTSSNPGVVSIDPFGTAWALAPGTANIKFTTFAGATLNEWTEHVEPYDPY